MLYYILKMRLANCSSQGHRLLIFVTTSKASTLKMLEVEQDFAKKVAVPAVSNLRELAVVLHESRVLNSEDVNQTISAIQERTGRDSVAVGVKSILDCIFEARAGGPNSNVVETLTDLIVEKMNEVQL